MWRSGLINEKLREKGLEQTLQDIFKSRARSKIYSYLLRKKHAKTEQIIKGTKLHPSTVRETLAQMHEDKQIIRKKEKNDNIGKNPFIYYPIPPENLLKIYAREIEEKLNQIAALSFSKKDLKSYKPVKIKIREEADQA